MGAAWTKYGLDWKGSIKKTKQGQINTVQFCANVPQVFSDAVGILVEKDLKIDAVDLNLGCPQGIARKGNYQK